MRTPLLWKLLAVPLLVLLGVLVAIWVAFDVQAARYFMTLMKEFGVDAPEVNEMFLSASHRTLIQCGICGLVLAAGLCYFLTRRLLRPLDEMRLGAGRVAAGEYDVRVEAGTRDELADLALAFNRMAESLAETERARKRMVVDVAHELRTPLTNLRGYVEAMQDGVLRAEDGALAVLHDELLRMGRLTEDLLSAARGAEVGADRRPVQLAELLEQTLELFRPRITQRGIDLRTDLAAAAVRLPMDRDRMVQVFGNLLDNCLQFSPDHSWVKVVAVRRPDSLRVIFSNPGEGIAADHLPRIFTPYYRGDESRSRGRGGAGLGLAIVDAHVRAHGGRVGASSDARATRVWVDLPCSNGRALPKR